MLIVDLPFRLPLPAAPLLLSLIQEIDQTAQKKRHQHHKDHDINIVVYCSAFLLYRFHRHIADQVHCAAVYRPHIVQRALAPDVMVKHKFPALFQALGNFLLQSGLLNIIGPVKVFQIQMPCAPLSHSCGFQHQPLTVGVHNIEHGPAIIKSLRQGLVQGVVDILHIERPSLPAFLFHRTLYSICPGSHMVQIGLGDGQAVHGSSCGEIQPFFRENFPLMGNALLFPGGYQRYPGHGLTVFNGEDVLTRILRRCGLLGHQLLKLSLFFQDRLNGTLYQIQAFIEILNRRLRHFPGYLPGHGKYKCPKDTKHYNNRKEQRNSLIRSAPLPLLFHFTVPYAFTV